jgi:hypothetical protein
MLRGRHRKGNSAADLGILLVGDLSKTNNYGKLYEELA